MKRVLFIAALVCMLAVVVASGVTYAATTHQVVKGNKLIGMAQFGMIGDYETPGARVHSFVPAFTITNIDCSATITIKQLSILDVQGNVVYEGPLYRVAPAFLGGGSPDFMVDWDTPTYTVVDSLGPHETVAISLMYMFPDPDNPGQWLSRLEAVQRVLQPYTVEIAWSTAKAGPLLTGTVTTHESQMWYDAPGNMVERECSSFQVAMVNR